MMSLPFDQVTDRCQREPGQAARGAQCIAVSRGEQFEIDAVAKHGDTITGNAKLDELVLQCLAHRDEFLRVRGGLQDEFARKGIIGNKTDIGAARRNHDRQIEIAAQPRRSHAVGVKIVRVDQIKPVALRKKLLELRPHRHIERVRRDIHSDFWNDEVAWVHNHNPRSLALLRH